MSETPTVRQLWLTWLTRLAMPILLPAARRQLREALPGETAAGHEQARTRFATLEALGRLLTGIAPWLESTAGEPAEQATRDNIRLLARQAIAGLVDPRSPDSGNFREGGQPVVNAAFLSHALLRAPARAVQPPGTGCSRAVARCPHPNPRDASSVQQLAALFSHDRDSPAAVRPLERPHADRLRRSPARTVVQGRRCVRRRSALSLGLLQQLRHPSDARGRAGYAL